MATVVLDDALAKRLRAERAANGGDRYDEVWEGTYMMAPMPNNEHQKLVSRLTRIFDEVIGDNDRGTAFAGVNISDRIDGWEHNYRVPDVAVFLKESQATDCGSYWHGGPDFAVEIVSPKDQTREKLGFYANVGTRELLIIDRDPWQLELYGLEAGVLQLQSSSTAADGSLILSNELALTFQLQEATPPAGRPVLVVTDQQTNKSWKI